MRQCIILSVLCIAAIFRCIESKSSFENHQLVRPIVHNDDLRGFADLWDNIKKAAINAWNSLQNVAQNAKEKIKQGLEEIKNRAKIISEEFQKRIKEIKSKSEDFMEKLLDKGQFVKECFENEVEMLDGLLEQIITNVTSCMTGNIMKIEQLENENFEINLNETRFIQELEKNFNKCSDEEDFEGCLYRIRADIYDEINKIEFEIVNNRTNARGIVDDLLDAMYLCSLQGLIDASKIIGALIVDTIDCVEDLEDN